MARTKTTPSIDPPIPEWAFGVLEERLGRSLAGWEAKEPLYHSPSPVLSVEGAWFDIDAVVRVVRAIRRMPHTKGRQFARLPFEPETWQLVWIIAPVFGWKNPNGTRIIREVWDEIPRKNGKSTISARLGLVLAAADGELGGEVYAAATSKQQAQVVLGQAIEVVQRSATLRRRCEPLTEVIRFPRTGTIFRALCRIADVAHGLNVSGAVIDEVHLHKNRGLIDAIETGTGAREQPLIIYITTAGSDDETTIYAEKHNYAVKLAKGEHVDVRFWAVIWAAEATDDPFSETTWAKANPNYPISPSKEYLEDKFSKAKETPSKMPSVLRLHLNIRGGVEGKRWPGADYWGDKGNIGIVVPEKLLGQPAWGGLVAASAADLTAIAWVFRNPEGQGWWAIWRHLFPEGYLDDLDERTGGHASIWSKPGGALTLTEGNETHVQAHIDILRADAALFDVRELAYDPNGANGIMQPVIEDQLFTVVPTYATSPGSSMIEIERFLRRGQFVHGANPIAAWQVGKLVVKETGAEVLKIDRKASAENVAGIAALEMAMRRALVAESPPKSAYSDDHGLVMA